MTTHAPDQIAIATKLKRCSIDLPRDMIDRVDALAIHAKTSLGCDVSRAAIVRAALAPWVPRAEALPTQFVLSEIRYAAPPAGTLLHRTMFAMFPPILLSLDRLWTGLDPDLVRHATQGRSALVLPALLTFLDEAEGQPTAAFEAIRVAIVKRGRKASR